MEQHVSGCSREGNGRAFYWIWLPVPQGKLFLYLPTYNVLIDVKVEIILW